jgi:hypothetical protein
MTEAEWLTSTDFRAMIDFARGQASDRKLRLFSCACVRRVWHLLHDERSRHAVEVSERYADGLATDQELVAAVNAAYESAFRKIDFAFRRAAEVAVVHAAKAAWIISADTAEYLEHPDPASEWVAKPGSDAWNTGYETVDAANVASLPPDARPRDYIRLPESRPRLADEKSRLCRLLREIVGNPWQPKLVDPAWREWNRGLVVELARMIYDSHAFDRMPILGDALEDAGCTDDTILRHCREPGEHVRGCWMLDAILGQE